MYVYPDTVSVSFLFLRVYFQGLGVYSPVAEPPLSKWEGQGSIPSTKKGRKREEEEGRERGEKGKKEKAFMFKIYKYSVKK